MLMLSQGIPLVTVLGLVLVMLGRAPRCRLAWGSSARPPGPAARDSRSAWPFRMVVFAFYTLNELGNFPMVLLVNVVLQFGQGLSHRDPDCHSHDTLAAFAKQSIEF
jgi:hypothetical protein